ncbi:hypothetical protein AVEN_133742-1 [Araneus ventricosus]|uniref:Secreted protein n=1 Tax=Araneus ventricosus TaxID=182803 RepID=A0A4Y2B9U7_ARAVE|nr:hypothetical protein AVEN_133742-1 [Araneus ventricosus]
MQRFPMLSTFLFLSQIVALLLPPPPLTALLHNFLLRNVMRFFGSQLLVVAFLKLIDISFALQSHDLDQRHNLVDCRVHRYCLIPLKVTFDNFSSQSFFQVEVRVLLVTPSYVFSIILRQARCGSNIFKTLLE